MRLSAETRGSGPDLVLVHGWGMNAAVWDGLPAEIVSGHRTARIELPGHGASPFDPAWADRDAWAAACLDAAPRRAVWLAWSLGALVALEAALTAPERVAALALITATPRFVQARDWLAAMSPETLDRFHDGLLADPSGALQRFLALQVRGSDAARETLRRLRSRLALRPAPVPAALAVGLDLLREGDLRERLPGLACPTLWLFGERDTLVPAAAAEGIAALVSGAVALTPPGPPLPGGEGRELNRRPAGVGSHVAVIPRAGHAPFMSHPQETSAAILSFLSEIER